jgi:hypothetical protein
MYDGRFDCLQHALAICHDLVIVEAKNSVPLRLQECITSCVALLAFGFVMPSAVALDHESRIVADEINDEWSNGNLASKMRPAHSTSAHGIPNDPLRVRQISPQ